MKCFNCNSEQIDIIEIEWVGMLKLEIMKTKRTWEVCQQCNHKELIKETDIHSIKLVWFEK